MFSALKYFFSLNRIKKRLVQVLVDCILIAFCFATAMLLRLEDLGFLRDPQAWAVLLPVMPVTIGAFIRLGLYRAVIRYISAHALRVVFTGVVFSTVVMALAAYALGQPIPLAVPAIYGVLLFLLVGGVRFIGRAIFMRNRVRAKEPVLIYGAGATGRRAVSVLAHGADYVAVGFVDDDRRLHGTTVAGLPVFGPSGIARRMDELKARAIVLAMPSISRARRREIIAMLEPLSLEVKAIPLQPGPRGGAALTLRAVMPEDLLGRDPMEPREDLMLANIAGKVVLVSGAGGSIGSELCRQILKRGPRSLVLLDVSEFALYQIDEELRLLQTASGESPGTHIHAVLGSVQNGGLMQALLANHGVQTVYHAAAYKHVPMIEDNVVEGVRNNVFGTRTLAEAAAETGVENFILVSTDKAVRPSSVMGATKRLAELVCQDLARTAPGTRFSMVRFGNVLGTSGSVIPKFHEQIARGGPVTVTHREITRYFMTVTEAAHLVIQAGAMARGGDVFVLDMGEPVCIFELARTMIRLHGFEPYVIEGDELPSAARGDIGIRITGPRKGEKLYEELLLSGNPTGTEHPRILTANEATLDSDQLGRYLFRLFQACFDNDLAAIREVMLEAPLGYTPDSADPVVPPPAPAVRTAGGMGSKPLLRVVEAP